jgi:hypothetical protein
MYIYCFVTNNVVILLRQTEIKLNINSQKTTLQTAQIEKLSMSLRSS